MARSLFAGGQGGLAGGCVQAVAKKGSFSDNSVCFAAGRLKTVSDCLRMFSDGLTLYLLLNQNDRQQISFVGRSRPHQYR
ncbi:hypothetical protein NEIELOOT_00622 [Neisseria elongata subsp. glycolytica ATCC 29315]|uniref:Lipoprotein n=1 Tax=Neisseria elongata subsp. glycolytica ATCC 29315 TaxID=546263 RepID=D4DNJ0_NEIEG|nr:hypothetical protein NEIELOOT_00622 [Neisseria elongata subsp. glycolytica ATCC 29315]